MAEMPECWNFCLHFKANLNLQLTLAVQLIYYHADCKSLSKRAQNICNKSLECTVVYSINAHADVYSYTIVKSCTGA